MTVRTRTFAATLAVAAAAVVTAATANAAVVPVNPGPIGAGRPIVGTTQNLPPLTAQQTYDAGDGFDSYIIDYYASGQATKDQSDISAAALKWVRTYVDRSCGGDAKKCKAMVVFDIDDTLESTYAVSKSDNPPFSYDNQAWSDALSACQLPLNEPVADFYKAVRKLGLAIGIVTGRNQSLRDETATCLQKQGISGWYELVTRTSATADLTAAKYKSQQRAAWEKKGFTIVASIGDQVSDMALGHLLRGFLLPNPMYMIP